MRLRRPRRRPTHMMRRRRKKSFFPSLLPLFVGAFFLWGLFRLGGWMFSDVRLESATATFHLLEGQAEFSLQETKTWTPAYSDQKFLPGDRVRLKNKAKASLEILGSNILFLDEQSEIEFQQLQQSSSGEKTILLKLLGGRVWARVSDDDFQAEKGSRFEIETGRLRAHVRGTIFDIMHGDNQDVLRLIKGNVDVDVLPGNSDTETRNIKVGVGQKLVVTSETLSRLGTNEEVLEIIDNEFIESEWHLQNLERFSPQEAASIRRRIEIAASGKVSETEDVRPEGFIDPPTIIAPASGQHFPANVDSVKIEGIAPENAMQMIVNDYTLTRFQPGDKRWVYFASQKFGTLIPGENTYSVVAVSHQGKRSEPATITLVYEGQPEAGAQEPSVATGSIENVDEFLAPVVTSPPVVVAEDGYQTSSSVVTIKGIVDPKTNAVEVNGFRLKQFQPGQTEFSYIANAQYDNMQEGENIYEIKAFGPDGKVAATSVKVIYTPIKLEN